MEVKMTTDATADEVIRILELQPHPEGGHYRQIYAHVAADGSRGCMSSTYFLLCAGERSHWHQLDAPEVWSYHAGAPISVSIWTDGHPIETYRLGSNLAVGERPQVIIPAGAWQTGQSLGDWSLFGCIVAPAFQFAGFELAPPGWSPPVHGAPTKPSVSQ